MKTLSPALAAHMRGEVLRLATCWKLTRRDGEVMGFTDHDADVELEGVRYVAASGFSPTAMEASAQLNVDNMELEGMLQAEVIDEADVLAGRYDYAEIEVFQVNYADLAMGRMLLRTGWLGEVRVDNGQFVAELRGLTQPLGNQIGALYAPACRARFGDARCGLNESAWTVSGTVDATQDRARFADASRAEAAGHFTAGLVRFVSGANAGHAMEVKEFAAGGQFSLALAMPYAIAAGDAYEAVAGCDKNFRTCVSRFNNAVNFRGEPHVPGLDKMLETAATRSAW